MSYFQSWKIGEQTLRVETPFPITYAVWDVFAFQTFPELRLPEGKSSDSHGRYLNRERVNEESRGVIADGQISSYWKHAYLPDDKRVGFQSALKGDIYVPKEQVFYLNEIAEDLQKNGEEKNSLLSYLNNWQKQSLTNILNSYNKFTLDAEFNDDAQWKIKDELIERCAKAAGFGLIKSYPYDKTLPYLVLKEFINQMESKIATKKRSFNYYDDLLKTGSELHAECAALL